MAEGRGKRGGPRPPRCLTCRRPARYCGLCWACLRAAYRAMRSGKASRETLERAGLILPDRRKQRRSAWDMVAQEVLSKSA